MNAWLVREFGRYGEDHYLLAQRKPHLFTAGDYQTWTVEADDPPTVMIDASVWHRLGGPKLKPGGGPLRIEGLHVSVAMTVDRSARR